MKVDKIHSIYDFLNENKELNENFWKWFGDSKMVDDQGDPVVVYHGSCKLFNEFDRKTVKYVGCNGDGFYFTKDERYAKTYGENVRSFYLKINNPLTPDTKNLTKDDYVKILDYIWNDEDYKDDLKNYGYFEDSEYKKFRDEKATEFSQKNDYVSLFDLTNTSTGSIKYIFDALKETTGNVYDAVISDGMAEIVVFYPNQIKSATKNNGYYDPNSNNIYE